MRTAVLSLFVALLITLPLSIESRAQDYLKSLILPDDIAERPPQVSYDEDLDQDIFTRENFYNKSAGTNQYRRTIRAPQKSMNFEVYNPVDDPATVTEASSAKEASTEAAIVEKDGKAVTVISIKKESVAKPETK